MITAKPMSPKASSSIRTQIPSTLPPAPPSSRERPYVRQPRLEASSTRSQSTRSRIAGFHSNWAARGLSFSTAKRRAWARSSAISGVSPKWGLGLASRVSSVTAIAVFSSTG